MKNMKQKKWKSDLARFSILYGPTSLFERVKFIMRDVHELCMDGAHFNERLSERDIPEEILTELKHFNMDDWSLKTVEVRKDRGKFYNSTWEKVVNGNRYWVTIGLKDFIMTIINKGSIYGNPESGHTNCVRSGELYDFVENVNRELMEQEVRQ